MCFMTLKNAISRGAAMSTRLKVRVQEWLIAWAALASALLSSAPFPLKLETPMSAGCMALGTDGNGWMQQYQGASGMEALNRMFMAR
jgi:hypothetical protein